MSQEQQSGLARRVVHQLSDTLFGNWLPSARQCLDSVRAPEVVREEEPNQANRMQQAGKRADSLAAMINPIEGYLVNLQSVLLWDKPYNSAVALIALNCFYLLIISWTRRFYSVLFFGCFFATAYKLWTNKIWPEIRVPVPEDQLSNEDWTPLHPTALSAPEIVAFMNHCVDMVSASCDWLLQLRRDNHGSFCLLVTSVFAVCAIIGKTVPGVVIVYILLMTIALGPGIGLHILPSGWLDQVRRLTTGDSTGSGSSSRLALDDDEQQDEHLNLSQQLIRELSSDSVGQDEQVTLDQELGLTDRPEVITTSDTERKVSTGSGINIVAGHFSSSKSSASLSSQTDDNMADEFEILSENEINEILDSENSVSTVKPKLSLLESDL
ncbi:hypothetical protein HDE_01869 [Halotydeus destructor]|nr:hypothetical protein HDE_01869 [Halotydeus destructor]